MNRILIILVFSILGFGQVHAQDTIKIVSWNVFLRPEILTDYQLERVDQISATLKKTDADVLCLQELFHSRFRKRLMDSLHTIYPFHVKPGRRGFRITSGLMLFSKHEIIDHDISYFTNGSGSDKMAWKGVQSATIQYKDSSFVIANTHLQAGSGPKEQGVRNFQYRRINTMLQDYYRKDFWIAGDFNTSADSSSFLTLKSACSVVDTKEITSALKYTSNFPDNGLYKADSSSPKRIDFILKDESSEWVSLGDHISRVKLKGHENLDMFLSDHALVESTFIKP